MPKASDVKRNMVVEVKGQPCVVHQVEIRAPSSRGSNTLYKLRLYNVATRQKLDETFKGDDMLPDVDFARAKATFSYMEGDNFVFMDSEDYSQYILAAEDIEEEAPFISEDLGDILVLLVEGNPVGLELPASVVMEITETAPSIKGATATKRNKEAVLSNGLTVQVPEYLSTGERIRINTATREFMSRE